MPNSSNKPITPPFDDISVSTKTVIARTNATYNIHSLFEKLPVMPYIVVPKNRGSRKKGFRPPVEDPNQHLPDGSIITLKYFEAVRGTDLKKKRSSKYFRNALSVVMRVGGKLVNFKLSKNGKFQMTGVKKDSHAVDCVKYIWKYILDTGDHTLYNLESVDLDVVVKVVMTNIDFSLGFRVHRESLDQYFNKHTAYHSLLETSFGYTGVNIKFPCFPNMDQKLQRYSLNIETREWQQSDVALGKYIEILPPAELSKEKNKTRYNTFLVFHSGNVIMSGGRAVDMIHAYNEFVQIIATCKDQISERLTTVEQNEVLQLAM